MKGKPYQRFPVSTKAKNTAISAVATDGSHSCSSVSPRHFGRFCATTDLSTLSPTARLHNGILNNGRLLHAPIGRAQLRIRQTAKYRQHRHRCCLRFCRRKHDLCFSVSVEAATGPAQHPVRKTESTCPFRTILLPVCARAAFPHYSPLLHHRLSNATLSGRDRDRKGIRSAPGRRDDLDDIKRRNALDAASVFRT